MLAVQINKVQSVDLHLQLLDINGRLVQQSTIYQGSTLAYFDTRTLYDGEYIVKLSDGKQVHTEKVIVAH